MKNILTIFRRDMAAYFTSPVGYIFMIVFLLLSVGLYITSFFTFPVADMRGYFTNLPILLCVFIPAVTMRVWAEERKENTWEMLLTFPMRARELVLGKFLTTLTFLALTLAATITVPVMLAWLGNPDNGAVLGGYLGTLFLGAFFLSIGIFFSGLCKDQIVAFVVTLFVCFLIFLLGTTFIASYIDDVIPGLGSNLSQLVGMLDHYTAFTRGVVEVADVLYFLVWTALFLTLNILFIEGRNRPGVRVTFSVAVLVCVAIGLAFNWLTTGQSLGRFDLTEDQIYTVSDASESILSRLKVPVQVKLYITPKSDMPTGLQQLEQDIEGKIQELRYRSNGNIEFQTVYLQAANVLSEGLDMDEEETEDEAKSIEERMLDKGLTPFGVQATKGDQVTQQLIYSSIGVAYQAEREEILPRIMPENLPELEYRLVNTIYKLTREKAPKIALVAPTEAFNISPQMRQLYMQMGQPIPTTEDPYETLQMVLEYEKYDVERVELSQSSPLPDEYDTLVIVNPREFSERQRWEINRALASGKSVVMAVQNDEWDYQVTRDGTSVSKRDQNPGVNELLEYYGLKVDTDILMDVNHVPLQIQSSANPLAALLGGGQTVNVPTQILVNSSSMDQETSITQRLSAVFYLWGSALDIDEDELKKHGLEHKVLMSTSPDAWKVPAAPRMTQSMIEPPATREQYPLMVMVTGQFPDAFKDAPRPAWPMPQPQPGMPPPPPPEDEGEAAPITPAPGKLILVGCAQVLRKNFLQAANLDLFLNSVDAVTLGDELINVRGRKPIDRTIDRPSDMQRRFWKVVNYALMNALIAAAGILVVAWRRQARNAYMREYAASEK
ncbi:MAG: Gldg family protein [Candidatus Hydrogenedentes bacterium]|nr:Gldg family protein [Candidatus Hydrogenedentota bacterium]